MRSHYLEVTFRKGKPLAAYFYLQRSAGEKSVRTETVGPGLLVDFGTSGKPIGIEITDPHHVSTAQMNAVLARLGQPDLDPLDLAPLIAA